MRRAARAAAVAALLALASCTSPGTPADGGSSSPSSATTPATSSPTPSPSPTPTPPPTLAWGPTEADLDEAIDDAAELTDAEAAGQVLIGRYSGTDPEAAAGLVSRYGLAGVILFAENVGSLEAVVATGDAVQAAVAQTRDWPAIVSTDNEGGLVQRLSGESGPWTTFPPFQVAGAASGEPAAVTDAYEAMGRELAGSGITLDLAPVADVTVGAGDVTIGSRSAGSDPQRVADTVVAALDGFTAGGVLTSVKHFPGHGSLAVDSHEALPVLDLPTAELENRDLVPFAAAVDAGASMVMMGHIAVTDWDPGVPASLSPAAYDYLRDELAFTGVAVTDGLDMGALTATRTSGQIAAEALAAGADLLLSPVDVEAARDGILTALAEGSLSRERLTQAAGRVVALVRWQSELAEQAGDPDLEDVGTATPAVDALGAAAVTLVAGECSGALAGPRIHLRGGSVSDWEAFAEAAEAAGLQVVPLEQEADTEVRLLVSGGSSGSADVAIALDTPDLLSGVDAPTQIAAFGRSAATMEALAAILTGEASATGQLPVAVGDLPTSACL